MSEEKNTLKSSKLKITAFREALLKVFYKQEGALSIGDIKSYLQNPVDRITLYRGLKAFQEAGIIHRINDADGLDKYALCKDHCSTHKHSDNHVHFKCEACQTTYCINQASVPEVSLPAGFIIKQSQMLIAGYCKSCKVT